MPYVPRFGGPIRPVGPAPIVGAAPQINPGLPAGRVPVGPQQILPTYHKGGKVKKTGPAMLKKGERVLTAQQAKRVRAKAQKILGSK